MASATKAHHPQTSSHKLEDQAANAALYVTKGKGATTSNHPLLDDDGKLSSASAATSLKYAKPKDLPSFPSAGLKLSSAGAAASLADSNKKSVELWKPDALPAANKAATLAKDYEMDPLWQPELSSAGSRAAILAARDGGHVDVWRPTESEAGSSAAGQAIRKKPPGPITEREVGADNHRKALLAATGAMSGSRKRADSAPIKPQNNASWALNAATKSQRDANANPAYFGSGDPGFEAARIQNVATKNVSRQMYTSNPPVAIEVEEKNRQDTLRASAVAMAQKMYAIQQSHIDQAKGARQSDSHSAANHVHHRGFSDTASSIDEEPLPTINKYPHLEEAARKLAQERLAKLEDQNAAYRDYYGQSTPSRSRLSMRLRRRASSDGQADEMDEEQSRKIRSQMSIFHSKVAEIDKGKRQGDRDALLAAAQRNVAARMATMDDKVFQETGKSSAHQRDMWEKEAREKAQAESDVRMANHGKVHIGGGVYLDQSRVDAIAKARLQPTLDEISDTAEKHRARDEEIRLDQEKQKRDAETEKARAAEAKAESKRVRDLEKQEEHTRKAEEKRVQKEAIAAEKERARVAKEENRKSKDGKGKRFGGIFSSTGATAAPGIGEPTAVDTEPTHEVETEAELIGEASHVHYLTTVPQPEEAAAYSEPAQAIDTGLSTHQQTTSGEDPVATTEPTKETSHEEALLSTTAAEEPEVAGSSSSPKAETTGQAAPSPKGDSKVRNWLKARFRSSSKTQKDIADSDGRQPGFIGGAALTGAGVGESSPDRARSDSAKEVALVGRSSTHDSDDRYGTSDKDVSPVRGAPARRASRSPSISSLSSSDDEAGQPKESRGRRGFKDRLLGKTTSTQSADDNDDFEEARDTFEEEKLTPPPKLSAIVGGGQSSKSSNSPSRERSKFTEVL